MTTRTPTRTGLIGLALTAAVSGLVLVPAGGASAQSYEWSPQATASRLTGTLTFLPYSDHGGSFQCKVVLNFRTGNVKRGLDALPEVYSATINGKGCESVQFIGLPWYVGANGPGLGSLTNFGWSSPLPGELCELGDGSTFTVMADGTWVLDSHGINGCLAGSLASNPPVTIVPRP